MKFFEEQKILIRWNNAVTDYFTISNGIKQGGVFSPVLFSLYLGHVISQLRHIGMGCSLMIYLREYLYMLMTSRYWKHQEQAWYLCWKSVGVLR